MIMVKYYCDLCGKEKDIEKLYEAKIDIWGEYHVKYAACENVYQIWEIKYKKH